MIKLEVDLFCEIGTYIKKKRIRKHDVAYRLYVDDELMTERDYPWDNNEVFIREVVPLHLEKGVHTLKIENLNPGKGDFRINTIRVNGKETTLSNGKEFKV